MLKLTMIDILKQKTFMLIGIISGSILGIVYYLCNILDFIKIYSEYGMIGVVGAMFVYLVFSMSKRASQQAESLEDLKVENRGQSETLENTEGMIIKLIERWNKSDEISLRHREDVIREIGDLSEKVSYLSGRINGNSK